MQLSSPHRAVATALAVVATLAFPPILHAQLLGGQAVDRDTQQGIAAVLFRLVDEAGVEQGIAVTNSAGGYVLTVPRIGTYTLHVSAWGYFPEQVQNARIVADTVISVVLTATPEQPREFVRGIVMEDSLAQPVPLASVLLIDEDDKVRNATATDEDGLYGLPVPEPGSYSLRVDAAQHKTLTTPEFEVDEEQTAAIEVRMSKQVATELEAVTVSGEAMHTLPLYLREFEYRRMKGFGEFVTREQIEEKGPYRFTDALRLVPSVKVVRIPPDPDRPWSNLNRNYTIRIKGLTRSGGGDCVPAFFLDGVPMGPIDDAEEGGPDVLVFPHDLEGIEVYRPSTVPPEFRTLDSMCGVVVAWTRRGS
jgi:hypothetical protein